MSWVVAVAATLAGSAWSSHSSAAASEPDPPRPRLVVLLVIDQFRCDLLTRFETHYGAGGFRRLLDQGAFFANAYYSFGATATAAGHATLGSGRLPRDHGVVSNEWFPPEGGDKRVAVADPQTRLVGIPGASDGRGRSPRVFQGHALGDQLRLSDARSRAYGIALKDRAAILPVGPSADGAFWYDSRSGAIVSSSYYGSELPPELRQFNDERWVNRFAGSAWEPLLPPEAYAGTHAVGEDWVPIFAAYGHRFPHPLPGPREQPAAGYYSLVEATPFGNDIVLEAAQRLIRGQKLGQGPAVDLISIGFSSNDIVGHYFGPESPEVLDITVRSDRQLADLLGFLDQTVGVGAYLLALTADHGVTSSPHLTRNLNVPADFIDFRKLATLLNEKLNRQLGRAASSDPLVLGTEVPWLFCSSEFKQIDAQQQGALSRTVVETLRGTTGIADVYTAAELAGPPPSRDDRERWLAWRSYHPQRGGSFYLLVAPYYYEVDDKIAGHSMGFTHDRHVPIVMLGPGVRAGRYFTPADPLDIVPTIAALLGVEPPLGAAGRILHEALDARGP